MSTTHATAPRAYRTPLCLITIYLMRTGFVANESTRTTSNHIATTILFPAVQDEELIVAPDALNT